MNWDIQRNILFQKVASNLKGGSMHRKERIMDLI